MNNDSFESKSKKQVEKYKELKKAIDSFESSKGGQVLELIKKLSDMGASQRAIAKTFGISQSTVHRYIKLISELDSLKK